MDQSTFGVRSPGQLVETKGQERMLIEGTPRVVPFDGHAFLPNPVPPDLDIENLAGTLWRELDTARSALATLDATARSLKNPHLLSRPFRIQEAQASSRIENTIASVDEIVLGETGEPQAPESREVLNYLTALDWALQADKPISQWTIREMHRILLTGVRGDDKRPGEYRLSQAYIQGERGVGFDHSRFVPAPAEHIQSLMDNLHAFVSSATRHMPPLIAVAVAHYQFEAIHPFADGNGRVGRLVLLLSICQYGLLSRPLISMSAYFDRHRQSYYDLLLRVSTDGDWTSWSRFVCDACVTQALDAQHRAERLLALRNDWLDRVTQPRASVLLRELADKLFERPAVKASEVRDMLDITHRQAQRHIDRLVEHGILEEVSGRSYDRIYIARAVVDVIESGPDPA